MSYYSEPGMYVFGLAEFYKGIVSCWGQIKEESLYENLPRNNKGYRCWLVESKGSQKRRIRKDKEDVTWFSESASTREEAIEFVKWKADNVAKAKAEAEKKRFSKPTKSAASVSAASE